MDQTILDFFLTGMLNYGPPAFGLVLLLGAAGAPLPTSFAVIAAGAFGQQGLLQPWLAGVWGLAGAVIGDSISYSIGRFAAKTVEKRYGGKKLWVSATEMFTRRGGSTIFITRFLLTAVALPVNLLAGGSRYRYFRYLSLVAAGEAMWIVSYGGLGYIFGDQWEEIGNIISDSMGLILGLVVLGIGLYLAFRLKKAR